MSEIKLSLAPRTLQGKKLKSLRAEGLIPSVIYGKGKEPILAQSSYNETEKVLKIAGYHSPIDLSIDGKRRMALVNNVSIDPVTRRIVNIEFKRISANQVVEATTPVVLVGFETSPANVAHFALSQVMEEIDVKAKPSDLPKELSIDVSKMENLDDKITVSDITLPEGVEFANPEQDQEQLIASLYDPAAEAAAREAAEAAEKAAAEAAAAESAEGAEAPAEGAASAEDKPAEAAATDGEKSE